MALPSIFQLCTLLFFMGVGPQDTSVGGQWRFDASTLEGAQEIFGSARCELSAPFIHGGKPRFTKKNSKQTECWKLVGLQTSELKRVSACMSLTSFTTLGSCSLQQTPAGLNSGLDVCSSLTAATRGCSKQDVNPASRPRAKPPATPNC